MNRILIKDFTREIQGNKGRFFSIFFIVLLGSAFFSGIRSTGGDMKYSADIYYDETNMMDIRILSTVGLDEDDIEDIGSCGGVESVVGGYTCEALVSTGNDEYCTKVIAGTDDVNKISIKEGRDAKSTDECVVDSRFMDSLGYEIGDKINLCSGGDGDLSNTLARTEYTIVGTGSLPYYMDLTRGVSSIGDGKLDGFIVVRADAFTLDYYTEAYITVDGAKNYSTYSDEYDALVKKTADELESLGETDAQRRYDKLYSETVIRLAVHAASGHAGNINASAMSTDAKWYVLDRGDISSCNSYGSDAERMDNIGKVFPVIFFLVAALVSLTAMTRMAQEQRGQIGTLKALGYSAKTIAGKYVGYALLATVTGGIIGVLIGEYLLPLVIMKAYGMLYTGIPDYYMTINYTEGLLAIAISVACTSVAAFGSSYSLLRDNAASLMRPESPKNGRRIWLEYIPFLWKRFNFTYKATLRNLFRYKKRFAMTIIGIGGCMGLMVVGFGLRDSITVVAENQYVDIFMQDATVALNTDADVDELKQSIADDSDINESLSVLDRTVTLSANDADREAYIYVPEDVDSVFDFVRFRDRVTKQEYEFPKDGVALSEKTADMLSVAVGDEITIQMAEDEEPVAVTVETIVENYVQHYAFMTPETYERLFGEKPVYDYIYLKYDDNSPEFESELGNELLSLDACSGISFTTDLEQTIDDMLNSLYLVIYVLIISAALLAFVVIYNLNSINMTERRRELATLKVLGFYDGEVAMYIYRENIILTCIGIVAGIFFGKILHLFTVTTVEVDLMMFGRSTSAQSYVICALLTFAFSLFVNIIMFYSIRKIDMIESLKSIE